jgi:hypothetical protein
MIKKNINLKLKNKLNVFRKKGWVECHIVPKYQ